jgi:hypothetical protein
MKRKKTRVMKSKLGEIHRMGGAKERGCVRDERGTRLCMKGERLECHV